MTHFSKEGKYLRRQKIYVRKGLKCRCQSEFSKIIRRWIYSTSPVRCVHLWSLKVSVERFTLNSLMKAHKLFTLGNIELTGHHRGAFSTILCLEIYKRALWHGLIKAWSLAPPKKWMVEADRCSPAQGRLFTASLKDLFQAIHAEWRFQESWLWALGRQVETLTPIWRAFLRLDCHWVWFGRREGMRYNAPLCNHVFVLERALEALEL